MRHSKFEKDPSCDYEAEFHKDTVHIKFNRDGHIVMFEFYIEALADWAPVEPNRLKETNAHGFEYLQEEVNSWLSNLENEEKYDGKAV